MTYQKLVDLKYREGLTTHDLLRRFPNNFQKINNVALMDVPDDILREVIKEENALARLIRLKRRYSKFLSSGT